jgi:hypothetical protein
MLMDQDVEADHEVRCQSVTSDDVEEVALYEVPRGLQRPVSSHDRRGEVNAGVLPGEW